MFPNCCRVSSMPLGVDLRGVVLISGRVCRSRVVRASIERAIVQLAIVPAICGCVPTECCLTSFGNSCRITSCSLSVLDCLMARAISTKGERQNTSIQIAPAHAHATRVHLFVRAMRTTSALPCSHSRTQMYRQMNPDL